MWAAPCNPFGHLKKVFHPNLCNFVSIQDVSVQENVFRRGILFATPCRSIHELFVCIVIVKTICNAHKVNE